MCGVCKLDEVLHVLAQFAGSIIKDEVLKFDEVLDVPAPCASSMCG